jgi:hypothetical protein
MQDHLSTKSLQTFVIHRQNSPPFLVLELRQKLVSCALFLISIRLSSFVFYIHKTTKLLIPHSTRHLIVILVIQDKVVMICIKCVLSRRLLR